MRKPSLHKKQKGQAILLVAVLMVALIAALGLAIDGGGMFLMYRDVQNATDAAGLSAAFALCTGGDPEAAALDSAELNGFIHGQDNATVIVDNPPLEGSHIGDSNFVMVTITDVKPSYFIQIVYNGPMEVSASTTSRCNPGSSFGFPANSALVSLRATCGSGGSGGPNYAFRHSGAATVYVGGDIFVNQDTNPADPNCGNDSSMVVSGNRILQVTGTVCTRGDIEFNSSGARVVGGDYGAGDIRADTIDNFGGTPDENPADCNFDEVDPEPLEVGEPVQSELCPINRGSLPTNSIPTEPEPRTTWAEPGVYSSFSNSNHDVTYLEPGIYCVTGNIDIKGELVGDGVFIYQTCEAVSDNSNCLFSIGANGAVNLTGMGSGDYENLTFYSLSENLGNPANSFNGSGSMNLRGTFYVPYAHCDLDGGARVDVLGQFICLTSDFIGSGEVSIVYNEALSYRDPASFGIEE